MQPLKPGEAIYQKSEVDALIQQLQAANKTIATAKTAVADVMQIIPFLPEGGIDIPKIMQMVMTKSFPPNLMQSFQALAALVELPEPTKTPLAE